MASESCMPELQLSAFDVHWIKHLHLCEQRGSTRRAMISIKRNSFGDRAIHSNQYF